ncbi:hypothetical protein QMT40_001443 [Parvibaculaceae bacterium PLY_AMNH_Bact1]|nr:hypothetical protein QMT40_001443 [Parvibaculaceae bacterium PLY_AMNH_Bact1]
MTPLPQPRPSDGGGILDSVFEFGKGAIDVFFDFKASQNEAQIAADLRQSEALKLAQIQQAQQGSAVTPGSQFSFGSSLPSWVWPVAVAGGVGLMALAYFKPGK